MTRYLAISALDKTVANWGTPAALATYIEIISESLKENNNPIYDDDVSNRSPRGQSAGPFGVEGDVVFNPRPDNVGQLLAAILGSDAVAAPSSPTGCTSAKEHTMKQSDTLPHFTCEVGMENPSAIGTKKYDSLMVNSLALAHDPEGRLESTFGLLGRSIDISGSIATPSFSTLNPFVFHMADFKIAGSSNTDVENFSLAISNNLQRKPEPNTRFPGRYKPGGLVIEGSLDVSFENMNQFKRFLGSSTATTPQNTLSSFGMQVIYTSYTIAEACSGGDAFYILDLNMPAIIIDANNANIDKRERTVQNLPFRALYDVTNASALVAVLTNVDASAYVS